MARTRVLVLSMSALGIAMLLIWAASVSTVSTDQHLDRHEHTEEQAGPNDDLLQYVIDTLGFQPTSLTDLSPDQIQMIGQNCARPGEDGHEPGQDGPESTMRPGNASSPSLATCLRGPKT